MARIEFCVVCTIGSLSNPANLKKSGIMLEAAGLDALIEGKRMKLLVEGPLPASKPKDKNRKQGNPGTKPSDSLEKNLWSSGKVLSKEWKIYSDLHGLEFLNKDPSIAVVPIEPKIFTLMCKIPSEVEEQGKIQSRVSPAIFSNYSHALVSTLLEWAPRHKFPSAELELGIMRRLEEFYGGFAPTVPGKQLTKAAHSVFNDVMEARIGIRAASVLKALKSAESEGFAVVSALTHIRFLPHILHMLREKAPKLYRSLGIRIFLTDDKKNVGNHAVSLKDDYVAKWCPKAEVFAIEDIDLSED